MHVLWTTNPLAVFNFWLQVPFADAGRRTVSVLVCFALMAAETVITVRPPSIGKRPLDASLMPLFIPAGLAAFYITQPGEEIFPVVPLLAIVTLLMLALREFIQNAANVAHDKVIAADLARQRASLFDDFVQGDHRGEARGGFGLGLASARRMAALMQGEAGFNPRWRGGSAFFLELAAP